MATASPTPMASVPSLPLTRRTSQRQALRRPPSRPTLNRSESNPVPPTAAAPPVSTQSHSQRYSIHHDSSDDEIPAPMKLSALTKALLNDDAPEAAKQPSPPKPRRRSVLTGSTAAAVEDRRRLRSGSAQPYD